MSFQNTYFVHHPDVRLRPISELDVCLVYRPRPPKLFKLNRTAWLLLELADGAIEPDIIEEFRAITGKPAGPRLERTVRDGLAALVAAALVERRGHMPESLSDNH